jgi:hypothetical protein
VGVVGALVVAIAAVVLVLVLKDDGDGTASSSASPSASPSAEPTPPRRELALPATVYGKTPMSEADTPPVVGQVTTIFGQDFDAVDTNVYGTLDDPNALMITIGTKRSTVPSDFVKAFSPKSEATEQPAPWKQPGTLRCWISQGASVCLWGDDRNMLYVSSPESVASTAGLLERIYLGTVA